MGQERDIQDYGFIIFMVLLCGLRFSQVCYIVPKQLPLFSGTEEGHQRTEGRKAEGQSKEAHQEAKREGKQKEVTLLSFYMSVLHDVDSNYA